MPIAHWSPNLSVGVEELDADHLELIEVLNQLDVEVSCAAGHDAISQTLNKLILRTETHFQREEEIMTREEYPEAEHHAEIHRALSEEIQEFRKEFVAGMEIGPEITEFIKRWLISHIMESDKHLGGYLVGRRPY
jgi:hemerythrin